jgi:hypothetical protein
MHIRQCVKYLQTRRAADEACKGAGSTQAARRVRHVYDMHYVHYVRNMCDMRNRSDRRTTSSAYACARVSAYLSLQRFERPCAIDGLYSYAQHVHSRMRVHMHTITAWTQIDGQKLFEDIFALYCCMTDQHDN